MAKEQARLHVIISGKVHGVSFRYHTQRLAGAAQIFGWVRNNPDGTLEALLEGDRTSLERMAVWFSEGPRFAKVTECQLTWHEYRGEFSNFMVLP